MSNPFAWRCPNATCQEILGQVRCGVLVVLVPRPAVGGGKVAVECPECNSVRVWLIDGPVRVGGR